MRVLYCHDNVYVLSPDGAVYAEGQFPYSYWEVYREHFDDVVPVGRGRPLSPQDRPDRLNRSDGPGVRIMTLPDMNSPCGLLRHRGTVRLELTAAIKEADAVIIRAVSDIGWQAYRIARGMGKPVAMEMAACAWDSLWHYGSLAARLYAPVRYWHDRQIAAHADYVLYVSRQFLPGRYPARGVSAVASNVRLSAVAPEVLVRRLERIAAQPASGAPYVIGLIGPVHHRIKGIDVAIEAVRRLSRTHPGRFLLRILGQGDRETFERRLRCAGLADVIHFDGTVPSGPQVYDWLDRTDLYIQPSFHEGVPRAAIEAMSRGCPVLGSTAGGIPELLPRSCLHRPGDSAALAAQIAGLIDNSGLQEELARRNFAEAAHYTGEILEPSRRAFWSAFRAFAAGRAD